MTSGLLVAMMDVETFETKRKKFLQSVRRDQNTTSSPWRLNVCAASRCEEAAAGRGRIEEVRVKLKTNPGQKSDANGTG